MRFPPSPDPAPQGEAWSAAHPSEVEHARASRDPLPTQAVTRSPQPCCCRFFPPVSITGRVASTPLFPQTCLSPTGPLKAPGQLLSSQYTVCHPQGPGPHGDPEVIPDVPPQPSSLSAPGRTRAKRMPRNRLLRPRTWAVLILSFSNCLQMKK